MLKIRKAARTALAVVAALTAVSLASCANNSTPTTNPAGTGTGGSVSLINPGKLTVCTHLAYKPFQFKDDAGKIIGFDVDVMDAVAKKLGVTQDIVDIDFGQITSGAAFTAKKCDVGAAAITITDARKAASNFATPYFKATQALLVKADSGITSLADLKGKVVSVQTDTTGKDYADKNAPQYGFTSKVFDDMPTASNAVLAGSVAATINDNGVLYDFAKDNPTTKVVAEFQTGEEYGFNMSKDNAALLTAVNDALAASKADGTYNTIYKKWFKTDYVAQ